MSDKRCVCLGVFTGAHGVKGAAKIKTFTEDPGGIAAYGPVTSEDGKRSFTLTVIRKIKGGVVLVSAPEIKSREDAMALSGVNLFVDRNLLPVTDDEEEFYLEDLVGLSAIGGKNQPLGLVAAVLNFGAGDLIELRKIPGVKGARLIPFTKEAVPCVDLKAGRLTISETFLPANEEESPPPRPKRSKK